VVVLGGLLVSMPSCGVLKSSPFDKANSTSLKENHSTLTRDGRVAALLSMTGIDRQAAPI